jgi:hypothetical protein
MLASYALSDRVQCQAQHVELPAALQCAVELPTYLSLVHVEL